MSIAKKKSNNHDLVGCLLLCYHAETKDFLKCRVLHHNLDTKEMQVYWQHSGQTSVVNPEDCAFDVLKRAKKSFRRKRKRNEREANKANEEPVTKRQKNAFDDLEALEKELNWIEDSELPNLGYKRLIQFIRQIIPKEVGFPYSKLRKMKLDGKKFIRCVNDFYLKKMGITSKGARTALVRHMDKARSKFKKEWEVYINPPEPIVKSFPKRSRWDLPYDPKKLPDYMDPANSQN